MGGSISTGIKYVTQTDADVALILSVDQPFVTKHHLLQIAALAIAENKCILTVDNDLSGPPAAVPRHLFASLQALTKNGLKSVLSDFALYEGRNMLRDIDTPEDLKNSQQ